MSAKLLRTGLLPAWMLAASLGITSWCAAAPGGPSPPASQSRLQQPVQKPLTRDDVELLLREARAAIQSGRLDEADTLLKRAENSRIHYSLLHFGATPTSVRKEWNKARESQPKTNGLANNRLSGRGSNEPIDPFLANGQPAEGIAPAGMPQHNEPIVGAAVENPFTRQPRPDSAVAPASWDNALNAGSRNAVEPAGHSEITIHTPPMARFPEAPLPQQETGDTISRPPYGLLPPRRTPESRAADANQPASATKEQVLNQLSEAREALAAGNLDLAENLSRAATAAGVPETEFALGEDRPSLVAWDVVRAQQTAEAAEPSRLPALNPAVAPEAITPVQGSPYDLAPPAASNAVNATAPITDLSPRIAAAPQLTPDELPLPAGNAARANGPTSAATPPDEAYIEDNSPNVPVAPQSPVAELPPAEFPPAAPAATAHVEELPANAAPAATAPAIPAAAPNSSLIDKADREQQALARQISAEVAKRQTEANRIREQDPDQSLTVLREAQQLVKESKLPESMQRDLLNRIGITLDKTEKYIKDHAAEIELDKQNEAVLEERDRDRELRAKLEKRIETGVKEFNRLSNEHRYAEAELEAKRLFELAPEHPMVQQLLWTAKMLRRDVMNSQLSDRKEETWWMTMNEVDEASIIPVGDDMPMAFDQKHWGQFVKGRKGSKDRIDRRSPVEIEIQRKLKTPVMFKYENTPLSQVVDELSELTGVNVHLDPRGLTQEGATPETPVSLKLNKEIALENALNLLLGPLHLGYVVKDGVLKITSEQLRDGELIKVVYPVQDLVIPIPNFVPSNNIGLQGLINDAYAAGGQGQLLGGGPTAMVGGGRAPHPVGGGANENMLAQFNAGPMTGASGGSVPIGAGPGSLGGGANADFDSLIDLIVSTVQTETWAENGGGEAEIRSFPTNLSLVISQTQAVHEEIADLLEQLRRLQDLQVTIEVRFIRLNDTFFERIGVDFQMNIDDKINSTDDITHEFDNGGVIVREPPGRRSAIVGAQRQSTGDLPDFTSDLDVPFRQGGFGLAVPPPFSGFDPNSAARFGFAILSDIEAYFLIEAAQGDSRTNILNAPKVTLFNGQQAFVADATQRPFVVGVIPVVGEFAAAQQPVIVVLNEGTMMTIQAVVSDDRRYVRMTIVPFFTQIGDVDEFTFEGSSSTTESSGSKDDDGKNTEEEKSKTSTKSGVTVQLPSFAFVSVVTTVSVPDGGTVLLGGIKRLSEGRNEFGVPLLSKVPYINRLFRNVGIGRETDSLMMMVTPRIIIQEEEEERLGIAVP